MRQRILAYNVSVNDRYCASTFYIIIRYNMNSMDTYIIIDSSFKNFNYLTIIMAVFSEN